MEEPTKDYPTLQMSILAGSPDNESTSNGRTETFFAIDHPRLHSSLRRGDPVSIQGWYFDSKLQPALKVTVRLGDRAEQCKFAERPDVVQHFSHLGNVSPKVGFHADIDCDSASAVLTIEVITQAGDSLILDRRPMQFQSSDRASAVRPPVSIVIPALNGGKLFRRCLEAIRAQRYPAETQLLIIDSGSEDGTDRIAEDFGAEVIRIKRVEFHHSRTRQHAIAHARHDFVVFSVQDAVPRNDVWLDQMVEALLDNPEAVACYGRQEPHEDADLFARFETLYHSRYLGSRPRLQTAPKGGSEETYNSRLYRCRFDNVCAIYRRSALLECPFPEIPFGEDMAWAKAVQERGWSVAYEPRICVQHSHNRPPEYRMKRSFVDTICCARILGLLPANGPLLTGTSQLDEISRFAAQAGSLHNELVHNGRLEAISAEAIQRCLDQSSADTVASSWTQGMRAHVAHVLASIARDFPDEQVGAYKSCIDQAIASAHGTTLGNIYAIHSAANQIPSWFEEAMAPHFQGV